MLQHPETRGSASHPRRRPSRIPWVVWGLAAVAVALFVLPLAGLLWKAAWSSLWDDLKTPAARDALRLSLECSVWATALAVVLGVPLAWVLARATFPGRSLVRAHAAWQRRMGDLRRDESVHGSAAADTDGMRALTGAAAVVPDPHAFFHVGLDQVVVPRLARAW